MEYIALKGRPCAENEHYILYNCETYIVRIWRHGLAWYMIQAIEKAGICDKQALLKVLRKLSWTKKWFRQLNCGKSPKEIIEEMKEKKLIFSGSGVTAEQCITDLFSQTAFIPILRPGTADRETILQNEDKYMYLLHQEKLCSLERDVLDWVTAREKMLSAYPYEIVNRREIAEKAYNTIDNLEKLRVHKGCSRQEIIETVKNLYLKRCIFLIDKVPHEFLEPSSSEKLRLKTYEIFA